MHGLIQRAKIQENTATEQIDPVDHGLPSSVSALIGASIVGAAVSLSLGVYGRSHTPTGVSVAPVPLENLLTVKTLLTTAAAGLALFQLASALWMYGRLPKIPTAPAMVASAHRWSGTAAFLFTLPVAYHCLWSLGFQTTSTRVLIHSFLGCAFYGAFATKLLVLRSERLPGWAIPVVGSVVVTLVTGLWLSSALFYFTGSL